MEHMKLIAMDLDGTLTQHKTKLSAENRASLDALAARCRLLMVGAGQCLRIWNQMEQYPVDVIGNYGLQYGEYRTETKQLTIVRDEIFPCDRERAEERVAKLRKRYGMTEFRGDSVEYHPSGCLTFPILGTKALQEDKLAYDPDRKKRRAIYHEVQAEFPEYNVFVGGSSSFDMAPKPYDKYYSLDLYCWEHGYSHGETVFIGDDYGPGGNDESVYRSDFRFVPVDDYRKFPETVRELLGG